MATGNGDHSLMLKVARQERLPSGVAQEVFVGPVPVSITEWNWIQMSHAGHYSVQDPNNVIGDSWSVTDGCSGKNI